ncbi:unnamed protein product [[Candida] boidinii]|uniref:Unnamed protein product n=1 Tax=Candida boidinii TaxID=5477 RepID=A0ACB5TSW2_CANBO|nr:unnamed protein product [[Candida] boidinii]
MFKFTKTINKNAFQPTQLLKNSQLHQIERRVPLQYRFFANSRIISNESTTKLSPPLGMDDYELKIFEILNEKLSPKLLTVRDVSGGCGSMFAINIQSTKFKGTTMIKQHRLVNEILKDEISKWHGLQLKTNAV